MKRILLTTAASMALTASAFAMDAQTFVTKAAIGGMYEVQSSELVKGEVQNAEIVSFADMMIADHTEANEQLAALAQQKGLEVPAELDEKHAQMIDALEEAEGQALAATYVDQQVTAHEEAVTLYEGFVAEGDDAELVAFAETTLPTLRSHLDMARGLEAGEPMVTGSTGTTDANVTIVPAPEPNVTVTTQ